jgi:hypothetical protein
VGSTHGDVLKLGRVAERLLTTPGQQVEATAAEPRKPQHSRDSVNLVVRELPGLPSSRHATRLSLLGCSEERSTVSDRHPTVHDVGESAIAMREHGRYCPD